jgi:hypothetical protein
MLRTMIAVSENRMATTSPVTVAVRYRCDALYISPRDAHDSFPGQGESRGGSVARRRQYSGGIKAKVQPSRPQHPFRASDRVLGSDVREPSFLSHTEQGGPTCLSTTLLN